MIEPANNLLGLNEEVCAMGLFFPVYPSEDLAKLSKEKKQALATAIKTVLMTDPEVQQLLKDKTAATFQALAKDT
jgi:formaldehyde-activating enzyme involved in methanogenesis